MYDQFLNETWSMKFHIFAVDHVLFPNRADKLFGMVPSTYSVLHTYSHSNQKATSLTFC